MGRTPKTQAALLLLVATLGGFARAAVEIVAEEGAQVAGELPGVEWWWFPQAPVIGGRGYVAFGGQVVGPGISAANDTMILAGIPGVLHKVVQEGQPAPGLLRESSSAACRSASRVPTTGTWCPTRGTSPSSPG